ncbi:MAG: DUF1211 domain-containing protein [Betaproteobacteria bacterium]|nr:DUF1211 domain-containing protein [Betaproteobacteria bacterium]
MTKNAPESSTPADGMSKHRIDALTDGIFAVAMTLLVIELKIPDASQIRGIEALLGALGHLIPKFIGWVVSFTVLALFWYGHHRAFHYVHKVNGRLVALNILLLAFVSLMPFASGLTGEYARALPAQIIYSITMACTACGALLLNRYVYLNPQLCSTPMPEGVYRAARFRTSMLILISAVAVIIAMYIPGAGNSAFALMFVASPIARRIEAKYAPSSIAATP